MFLFLLIISSIINISFFCSIVFILLSFFSSFILISFSLSCSSSSSFSLLLLFLSSIFPICFSSSYTSISSSFSPFSPFSIFSNNNLHSSIYFSKRSFSSYDSAWIICSYSSSVKFIVLSLNISLINSIINTLDISKNYVI